MNSNMSEDLKRVNEESHPDSGARVPAGKDGRGCEDTLTAKHSVESVRRAVEDEGAAKKALDVQLGRHTPSGGRLGDATPQPQAGGTVDDSDDRD